MMKKLIFTVVLLFMRLVSQAFMTDEPIAWTYKVNALGNDEVEIVLIANIAPGWRIYSQHVKDGGPLKTIVDFEPSKAYVLIGEISESKPLVYYDNTFKMEVGYFENEATFEQKIKLKSNSPLTIRCTLVYDLCNAEMCLKPSQNTIDIKIRKGIS